MKTLLLSLLLVGCGDNGREDDPCCAYLPDGDGRVQACLDEDHSTSLADPLECGFFTCQDGAGSDHNYRVCAPRAPAEPRPVLPPVSVPEPR